MSEKNNTRILKICHNWEFPFKIYNILCNYFDDIKCFSYLDLVSKTLAGEIQTS